jgi:sodium/potassium-transporting ATPase subunit alpha
VCVALSLTIIAKRMAKRNVLVKNLATIETLGCMSVLCSDKTGTLTEGKMVNFLHPSTVLYLMFPLKSLQFVGFLDHIYHVDEIAEKFSQDAGPAPAAFKAVHMVARLCNDAYFDAATDSVPVEERPVKGDATDTAILRFAEALSMPGIGVHTPTLLTSHDKVFEIPFNSRNKWMLTLVRERQAINSVDPWMLVKGAPDVLFPSCSQVMKSDGTVVPFSNEVRAQLVSLNEGWSGEGQRVLALCRRQLDAIKVDTENMSANEVEELMYEEKRDMTLVGLVGIRDPPRHDVKDAIAIIRRAGVKVFMVTGDAKYTAVAIAKQVSTSFRFIVA